MQTVFMSFDQDCMSQSQLILVFLFGVPFLSLKQKSDLFFHVQSFISESMRFY